MSFIDDAIINAFKRILDTIASLDISNTLQIIKNICSYTVSKEIDSITLSEMSRFFLALILIATIMYAVYQLWFGEGWDKLKSDASHIYDTRKIPLAAALGGPELYSLVHLWIVSIAVQVIAATNLLIIFKIFMYISPGAVLLTAILNIFLEIAAYIYQWVLTNGYFLFRPLGIVLLVFPRNGFANRIFRIVGYNMLYPIALSLFLFTMDNTAKYGGVLGAITWVSVPFFSVGAFLILYAMYKYAWNPQGMKAWLEGNYSRTKSYTRSKAAILYALALKKIGVGRVVSAAAVALGAGSNNKSEQNVEENRNVDEEIITRR